MGEMSLLIDHFDMVARPLLQALLNSFWQGTIIAVMVWILLRIFNRASATTRHAVWSVSLLTIGMLPFFAIFSIRSSPSTVHPLKQERKISVTESSLPRQNPLPNPLLFEDRIALAGSPVRSLIGAAQKRASGVEETSKFVSLDESEKAVPKIAPPAVPPAVMADSDKVAKSFSNRRQVWGEDFFDGRTPMALIFIWLLGCLLMLGRIAFSYGSLLRMRRRLGFAEDGQRDQVQRLAEEFGIKRNVSIFISRQVSMPMTIGSLKPLIVLPPDLIHNLSTTEFESVIAHELAHIKRWDYLTNFLQRLVQSYLFFHPAVWFIGKHLMIERELACDDWAVKTCEPRRYACCLTKLVELLSESKPFIAATGILFGKHVISRRVEMILNSDRNTTTVVSKPAMIYTVGLAVVFICVCSLIAPVIAVPLAQGSAGKQQSKKENKSATTTQTKSQQTPPVPLPPGQVPQPALESPPESPIDVPDLTEAPTPEPRVAPLPPAPPSVLALEGDDEMQPAAFAVTTPFPIAPVAAIAQTELLNWQQPTPAPAPRAGTIVGREQDDKNKTAVISESELLNVLTDIVKRDSDPSVRNEALQGIYRVRTDAAINTLIQLYDGTSDTKVKGEIIGYLLRRTGDNSKAIAKLMAIAKSEPNEELRGKAVRYLGGVKGDEGANNLIQIYDGLQDSKMKQTVIRYLAYNKSRKAVDKLIQIAKSDTDPAVRQSAIRSLYGIDNRIYLDFVDRNRPKIGLNGDQLRIFELDKLKGELDSLKLFESPEKWKLDFPEMQFDFKEFQNDWIKELTPEVQEKSKEIQKVKPKNQSNVEPAPRPKRVKAARAV